ncbi:hypothetical protein KI387_003673, partial [Taxus chinensis]
MAVWIQIGKQLGLKVGVSTRLTNLSTAHAFIVLVAIELIHPIWVVQCCGTVLACAQSFDPDTKEIRPLWA